MIEITCTGSAVLDIEDIKEFQGELKKRTDKELDQIEKSILKYGFSFPFFIWERGEENLCLDGHGRLLALKRMRLQGIEVPLLPIVNIMAKSEEEAKNKLLRLNSQYGKMSKESVLEFASDIEVDFDEICLPDGEIFFLDNEDEEITKDDDESPEPQKKAISEPGEMYQLGNHILICGDSTDKEIISRLMGSVKADLWITDPPYNVGYEGKTKKKLKIDNDAMSDTDFKDFLIKAFSATVEFVKEGSVFYIWHADLEGLNFRMACEETGLNVRQCLVWNKNSMVLGRQDYQWKHEPCLYGWKDGASHAWYSDRKQTTILNFDRPQRNGEHPTMKPVKLIEYLIENSSKKEDIVFDSFGGSGTTMIACEKSGRIARLVELDPLYCDVIRRRWTKWAKENNREVGSGGLE